MNRAEIGTDEYISLTSTLEGIVILKKNPDFMDEVNEKKWTWKEMQVNWTKMKRHELIKCHLYDRFIHLQIKLVFN